jgi:hypothetical protein
MEMEKIILFFLILLIFVGCDRGQHLDVGKRAEAALEAAERGEG